MTGRLYLEGEADINDWTVTGEPELRLVNPAVPTGDDDRARSWSTASRT